MTSPPTDAGSDGPPTLESCRAELAAALRVALAELDAEAAALFGGADGKTRGCDPDALIDVLAGSSEDPRRLVAVAATLGRSHAAVGVHHSHYHVLGIALLRALARVLGTEFTGEMHDTWNDAFALASAVMERAAARGRPVLE